MSGSLISVPDAFERIERVGDVAGFDRGSLTITGGHLQGVGRVDARTLAISTSATGESEVAFVEWPDVVGTGEGRVVGSVVVGEDPLDHAGGLQIADAVLAVGVEDNDRKDRSRIVFVDLSDRASARKLDHLEIDRPGPGQTPAERRWTAGAVGLARVGDSYLVVVGSWDCDELDFYLSTGADLRDPTCRFEHVAEWTADDADRDTWVDGNWGKYQSLNLAVAADGGRFVVGGNRNRSGEDWIDLLAIDLSRPPARLVDKVSKRHMTCREGASFRWAGGVVVDGDGLLAIATESDLEQHTTINMFPGATVSFETMRAGTRFLANRRSRETHSLLEPCPWVGRIAERNRLPTDVRPDGYRWCDHCFPERADG